MATISQYLAELDNQRNQLAANLVTMGVSASEDEKLNTLVPKVLQIPSSPSSSQTMYDADDYIEYYSTVFIQYQSVIYSLIEFIQKYPAFCSETSGYALTYTYDIFGWDSSVYSCSTTPLTISSNSKISIKYKASSGESGILRLVQSDTGEPSDIITKAQTDGSYIDLSFAWLYTSAYVENLISCSDVPAGTYYIVWVGRTNNISPSIYSIMVI